MDEYEAFESIMKGKIQNEGESLLERKLTKSECEDVLERVDDMGLIILIQEKIEEMLDYNKLIKRNRNSEKTSKFFKLLWKNENEYVKEFRHVFSSKTLEDIKAYVRERDYFPEFDVYKIIKVEGGVDKEEMSYDIF